MFISFKTIIRNSFGRVKQDMFILYNNQLQQEARIRQLEQRIQELEGAKTL
ncbi:hypothetical protein HZB01_00990 [Candidatus Woesearchaeota archaeon]|nr:hypothetical protein [Candidatus Woesearchaeota archaeon]